MGIDVFNSYNRAFDDLMFHRGHKIVIATYGDKYNPENISIECETCCCVLIDFDNKKKICDRCAKTWIVENEDKENDSNVCPHCQK